MEWARGLAAILGDRLLGAYLGGSATMGDFVAGSSDYDVLAVIDGELTADDRREIDALHRWLLCDRPDALLLEGDYAPRHLLVSSGTSAPVPGIQNGRFVPDQAEIMLSADNLANVRGNGIRLWGLPAAMVLPDVTPDDVRAAVLAMLREGPTACRSEAEAASEILGIARSLCALESGLPTTKSEGAQWALSHLDARWHGVIQQAQAVREGLKSAEGDWTLRRALPELDHAVRPLYAPSPRS